MFAQSVPQPLEFSVFGGGSFFEGINQSGYSEKLVDGGTVGGRVAYNFSQHFALEANYNFSVDNLRLTVPGQYFMFNQTFGDQLQSFSADPVYHFTRRASRLRPYITAGVGPTWFVPTKQARALFPALGKSTEFVLNYGAGLKYHFSEHLGLRLDARAGFGRNPDFGLPNSPSLHLNGVEATAGFVFTIGRAHAVNFLVPPPAPEQKPTLQPLNPGELSGATGQLCQGRVLTLHATATDPAGHALSYKWKANGAPVGTNDPDLSFKPNNAGDFEFEVEVSDASDPTRTIRLGPKTLAIQDYVLPKISGVTASPNSVTVGSDSPAHQTVILAADVASSACGGNLSYKWTVSEGTLTNAAGPSAQFDTASLNFDSGLGQTKTITATVTATDETGQSASQNATFVVDYPAQFKRLGDVIFAKDSVRVNNCGKRILIELAAPQAGSAFDILLIGHRAKDELENVRKSSLDTQRLLSVAAVLTGGHGVCGNLDLSQVHLYAAGIEQVSAPDPGFCGTSNLPQTAERSGVSVKDVDKERRVEVYLVPKGSHVLPPGARNAVVVSVVPAKMLGCPK